jgi:hypothetical protein
VKQLFLVAFLNIYMCVCVFVCVYACSKWVTFLCATLSTTNKTCTGLGSKPDTRGVARERPPKPRHNLPKLP